MPQDPDGRYDYVPAVAALSAMIAAIGAFASAETISRWSARAILLAVCVALAVGAVALSLRWSRSARLSWMVRAVSVLVVVAALVIFLTTDGDGYETKRFDRVCVGPEAITSTKDSVWVACAVKEGQGEIAHFDAGRRSQLGRAIEIPGKPHDLLVHEERIWVVTYEGTLLELGLDGVPLRKPRPVLPVKSGGGDLVLGNGVLWINDYDRAKLVRVGLRGSVPASESAQGRIDRFDDKRLAEATGLAYSSGTLWVTDATTNTVLRFGDDGEATGVTELPNAPSGKPADPQDIAVGAGSAWVADSANQRLFRISVDEPAQPDEMTFEIGESPSGVSVGAGAVWISNKDDDNLRRIDLDDEAIDEIDVGVAPVDVTVAGGRAWSADHKSNSVTVVRRR